MNAPSVVDDMARRRLIALERKFRKPAESRNDRLTRMASALGDKCKPRRTWTNKRLYQVLAGKPAGPILERAITLLYNERVKTEVKRRDRWRLHVEFQSREEWQLVRDTLDGEERRRLLLAPLQRVKSMSSRKVWSRNAKPNKKAPR